MQFVLSVEVSRLGTYAMLPNSFLTPRSLVPYNEVRVSLMLEAVQGPYLAACQCTQSCKLSTWLVLTDMTTKGAPMVLQGPKEDEEIEKISSVMIKVAFLK